MFCGKCGKQVPVGYEFCMNCGTKLAEENQGENVTEQTNAKEVQKKKSSKKIIILSVTILVLAISIFFGWKLIVNNQDYMRNTSWGMTMDEVQEVETVELELQIKSAEDKERAKSLAEISGEPYVEEERLRGDIENFEMFDENNSLFLNYVFVDNKLISISIVIDSANTKINSLINKYNKLYGDAVEETDFLHTYNWSNAQSIIELTNVGEISVGGDTVIVIFTDITYED